MKKYRVTIRVTFPYHVYEEFIYELEAYSSSTALHEAVHRTEFEILIMRKKEDYEIADITIREDPVYDEAV